MIRTDATGGLAWIRYFSDSRYGTATFARFNDVQQTPDGSFIMTGDTANDVSGSRQNLLVKTTASGNVVWSKTYDNPGYDSGRRLDVAANGDYLVTGYTTLGEGGGSFLMRVTSTGILSWYRTFFFLIDDFPGLRETALGDIVLSGTATDAARWDIGLLKTDANGSLQWAKAYGDALADFSGHVLPTLDGGFVVAGTKETSNSQQLYEMSVIKTDGLGDSGCNQRAFSPLPGTAVPPIVDLPLNAFTSTLNTPLTTLQSTPVHQENVLCRTVRLPLPAGPCACTPPPSGMLDWWTFDETAGPAANDSARFNNVGTLLNGASHLPAGKVAAALHLDGTDDYVDVPNHSELNFGTGDLTIDAWVRTTAASGILPIVDKRDSVPVGYTLFLLDGRLGFQMGDGSTANCNCSSDPATSTCTNFVESAANPNRADGAWHHVAVTVNRGSTTGGHLYVNGMLVSTFNPTIRSLSLNNTVDLWIGRRQSNGCADTSYWQGDLDEVELFSRELQQSEIQAIFNADANGKCKCDPDIGDPTLACPLPVGEVADAACRGVPLSSQATDLCDPSPAVVATPAVLMGVGLHTVGYTATDASGNSASCSTQVQLADFAPPVMHCPQPSTLIGSYSTRRICAGGPNPGQPCVTDADCLGGTCVPSTVCSAPAPGASGTDNCDGSLPASPNPTVVTAPGFTMVTYTATDSSGNAGSCGTTFDVVCPCPSPFQTILVNKVNPTSTAEPDPAVRIIWPTAVSVDAIRGSLSGTPLAPATAALRPSGGFTGSVNLCLATNSPSTAVLPLSGADVTDPGVGNGLYYLVRQHDVSNCGAGSYSTGVPTELGSALNPPRRDTQIGADPSACP